MHPLSLALQGGGAHGAYSWGVLEELLLDGRVSFPAISATSSGAMNAAVMVAGLIEGGPSAAVAKLEQFWRKVSEIGRFGAGQFAGQLNGGPFNAGQFGLGQFSGLKPPDFLSSAAAYASGAARSGFDFLSRYVSPYQFNPLGLNPLRDALLGVVDFSALQQDKRHTLHVCATNVLDSSLRVFSGTEVSADAVMASACLPTFFQAVEIDGQAYWDGGFMGNPALTPLVEGPGRGPADILIVQINPLHRATVPQKAEEIADRLNEISFNAPLLIELRAIERINRLLAVGHLDGAASGLRPLFLHRISDEAAMSGLSAESKVNPEWGFLNTLREAGRRSAKAWLKTHLAHVGLQSTFTLNR